MGSSIFLKTGNYAKKKKNSVGTYEKQPRDSPSSKTRMQENENHVTREVNICILGLCEFEGCSEEPPSLGTSKCLQGAACYYCPVLSRYVLYMLLCVFSVLALSMLLPSSQSINQTMSRILRQSPRQDPSHPGYRKS